MDQLGGSVATLSHAAAALGFTFLSVILVVRWVRGRPEWWLLVASVATAAWAWVGTYLYIAQQLEPVLQTLDIVRSAAWVGFLLGLVTPMWEATQRRRALLVLPPAVGVVCLVALGYEVFALLGHWDLEIAAGLARVGADFVGRLLIAVVGLLLVENFYRNTQPDYRWSIKMLCLGLGALFAYDFFLYSDALLFKQADPALANARGFIAAAIVPLIFQFLRRDPDHRVRPYVSRQTAFHTATFVGAGAYLLMMWAVALYLRDVGGEWGSVLQVIFLFAAFLVLAAVLFSGGFRAWLKIFISKHFFHYRYDYRQEWLRLIETISSGPGGVGLAERVIRAVADIVESPEGLLWVLEGKSRFVPGGAWQVAHPGAAHPADPEMVAFFESRNWVIDLEDYAARRDGYPGLEVPPWLRATKKPWLLVPLIHHDGLFGIITLHRSRAPRSLDWEDYDLLKTVGRQAAYYLAEQQAARQIAESRQFDQFNRRFAFVLHDIKNLVSQLSLIVSNAERHRDDPEFQKDMIETIQESVTKMNHLLVRLHKGGKDTVAASAIDLATFLDRIAERCTRRPGDLSLEYQARDVAVLADEERLSAVMAHLIDNALDATADEGRVDIRLSRVGDEAVIEVEDDGPGMEATFVREKLFQPFTTTKQEGYGIGAFESREYVRELGGHLDVTSRPGVGTLVRIALPAVDRPSAPRVPEEMTSGR